MSRCLNFNFVGSYRDLDDWKVKDEVDKYEI